MTTCPAAEQRLQRAADSSIDAHARQADAASETQLLYLITQELLSPQSELDACLEAVLGHLAAHLGVERAMITIVERVSGEVRVECSHGLSSDQEERGRYHVGEGVIGRVIARREPALIPAISGEPLFLDRTRSRIHLDHSQIAFVCVPVADRSEVLGTLSVDRSGHDHDQLGEDLRLLSVVAAVIAEALRTRRDHYEELEALRRENARLEQLAARYRPESIIGTSRQMQEVFNLIPQVARSKTTVLIRGESGTGKELIAREIHARSDRADKPFITLNCGTLPEQLVESELFGHVRGAYTGATSARRGRFEQADGGTIFLDEIGELPPPIQVKLLRVLQEGEFHRLGEEDVRRVDARVIAATNANLETNMSEGRFREDLYYRLNVFPIFVPPLRERTADITLLADYFVERYAREHGRDVVRISTAAIELMTSYHWPGNVRELENCISRAVLLADENVIRQSHLPPTLQTGPSSGTSTGGTLKELMMAYEREILIEAMKDAGGNQTRAAKALGTTPRILSYALKRHDLHDSLTRGRT